MKVYVMICMVCLFSVGWKIPHVCPNRKPRVFRSLDISTQCLFDPRLHYVHYHAKRIHFFLIHMSLKRYILLQRSSDIQCSFSSDYEVIWIPFDFFFTHWISDNSFANFGLSNNYICRYRIEFLALDPLGPYISFAVC